MGGLYLSSYGSNDGLVNEWSAKAIVQYTFIYRFQIDRDNINKKGSTVLHELNHIYVRQMWDYQL